MKLTIDNLDGLGALDYSGRIYAEHPLQLERKLNAPSRCSWMLDLNGVALATPARRARVTLTTSAEVLLFTGYVVSEPELMFAGQGLTGPAYLALVTALSDEWLLDKQSVPLSGPGLAERSGNLLEALTARVDANRFVTMGATDTRSVGVFDPQQAQNWSTNAGALADSAYSAYRVMNGVVSLQTAGAVTHTFGDGDGALQTAVLRLSQAKELANDVTVSGEKEPAAYVTEIFEGDGTTSEFKLSSTPFRGAGSSEGNPLLTDSFNESQFDPRLWTVTDPGSHLGFSGAGLQVTGGNGFDGQTMLLALDPLEIGGALVIEAGYVQLQTPSDGVLCGVYSGPVSRTTCLAGYNVRQSTGSTVLTPFVNGAEVGTTYTIQTGHQYTLRVRLYCPEVQRVLQVYYAMGGGVIETFGGGLVDAPLRVVFDLQDLGNASDTPATVLYDGALQDSTAVCAFALVNSLHLTGTIGYCRVRQTGSAWVRSMPSGGVTATRLIGVAGEGVDCLLSASGALTFLLGRIPLAGELITVNYRSSQRAITRIEDAASVASEAEGGQPGSAQWLGKVLQPPARSTADCESAAQAILSFSANRDAALSGSYSIVNPPDVWPGDLLDLVTQGRTASVVVRAVTIKAIAAWPEALEYQISFANDWAEGLGVKLSEAVATDVLLPQNPISGPSDVLSNLQSLQIVSATSAALQIDTGTVPPTGGGFEVRRRDGDFGPAIDQDLVLRSPVRSFSIPREGQVEHYYIRMYDGSTPPIYSRFSSAVFTNLPVG